MRAPDGLFSEPARVEEPERTPGQVMKDRQRSAMELGQHPLSIPAGTSIPLHADASPDPEDGGPRCGSCAFRVMSRVASKPYPKCAFDPAAGAAVPLAVAPRANHGLGTDVRAWWPACQDWSSKEEADG